MVNIAHYFTSFRSPLYLTYYVPDCLYRFPVIFAISFWHVYVNLCFAGFLYFSSIFMYAIEPHLNFIVSHDLRMRGKSRTPTHFRTAENIRITYRTLQLLHYHHMSYTSVLLFPVHWLTSKMIMFCGSKLIKYHKVMSPVVRRMMGTWTSVGLISWVIALEQTGYMQQYSQRAISSWQRYNWGTDEDNKLMSKFRKSCRPMVFAYGKLFVVKRITVLTFLRSIGKNMFKAYVAV